jgi:hypothetical protein
VSLEEATPGEPCSARCGRDVVAAEQVAELIEETRWPS